MEEDLLIKMLLSLLLVYYYEEYESLDNYMEDQKDQKNKKIVNSNNDLKSLINMEYSSELESQKDKIPSGEDELIASEHQSNSCKEINYERELQYGSTDHKSDISDIASELISYNEIGIAHNGHIEKEEDNILLDDNMIIDNVISTDVHKDYKSSKLSNIDVLLASLEISIEIERLFKPVRERIYKVEQVLCDIKEIEGNLLLLKTKDEFMKAKLFYNGIARIQVKCLCLDYIDGENLYCNTRDIILFDNFSKIVDAYIENKLIEDTSSVNIPVKVDLLTSEYNIKTIVQEPIHLYDIKENYYKAFTLIGGLSMKIALLKPAYVEV